MIYDLTQPIAAGMAVWPGDPPVTLEPALSLAAGQGANVARLSLGTHTGTHVDAPAHLLPGGATVETLPLAALVGPAVVVEIGADPARDAAALLAAAGECPRLLLKRAPGCAAPAALSGALAARLAEAGLRLVGVDGPSVDAGDDESLPAHHALLSRDIIIVEGLALAAVPPGRYDLVCLPLPLVGADGAPARAILMDEAEPEA